jgi:hypothetical protein
MCIRQLVVELGSRDRMEELFKSTFVAISISNNIGSDEEFFGFESFYVQ